MQPRPSSRRFRPRIRRSTRSCTRSRSSTSSSRRSWPRSCSRSRCRCTSASGRSTRTSATRCEAELNALVPLAVAIPIVAGAAVAATTTFHWRRPVEVVATTVAVCVAALAAFLVALSFVYGWHYFDELGQTLFHALTLIFLAAMVGFALTGDLFNLFVFFELATVPAIVLTGYMNEERGPLQGEMNFAVTNTLGAFLVLTGIGLLYARTGALTLARIGEALAGKGTDGLVVTAFALLVAGFFVKAAVVPFHFWLADGYAVAPAPVCVLFSGIMSELGLYAVARVYWTSFSGAFGAHEEALRAVFLGAGVVTALVGAVMALQQRNLKRLLAFATIAHIGLFLMGIGLLDAKALAGAGVWVVGDGLVRGALFMCVGILVQRFGDVDDVHLRGLGRAVPFTGVLFVLGALALATLPPFGSFAGKALVEGAALDKGYTWVPAVILVVSALVGGAVLGAAGGGFPRVGAPGPEGGRRGEGKAEGEG